MTGQAFIQVGKQSKAVIAITDYTPDGTCSVVYETSTCHGQPIRKVRRVSLRSIQTVSPLSEEIHLCEHIVQSFSDLVALRVDELLPLSGEERGVLVRVKLAAEGIFTAREAHDQLVARAQDRKDLVKYITILAVLDNTMPEIGDRQLRNAALEAYQRSNSQANAQLS